MSALNSPTYSSSTPVINNKIQGFLESCFGGVSSKQIGSPLQLLSRKVRLLISLRFPSSMDQIPPCSKKVKTHSSVLPRLKSNTGGKPGVWGPQWGPGAGPRHSNQSTAWMLGRNDIGNQFGCSACQLGGGGEEYASRAPSVVIMCGEQCTGSPEILNFKNKKWGE